MSIVIILGIGFSTKNLQATVYNIATNVSFFNLGTVYASDILLLDPGVHVPITFYGEPINGSEFNRILITNGQGQVSFTGNADQLILFDHAKFITLKGDGYSGLYYGIECYSSPGTIKQDGIMIGAFSGYIEVYRINISNVKGSGICSAFEYVMNDGDTYYSYTNPNYKAAIKDLRIWDNWINNVDQHGIRLGEESVNTPYIISGSSETVYCPRLSRPIYIFHNKLDSVGKNGIAVYGCELGRIYSNEVINFGLNIEEDENPRCDFAAIVVGGASFGATVFCNTIRDGKGHGILDEGDGRSLYSNNIITRAGLNNDNDEISAFQMNQTCVFSYPMFNDYLFYIYHNSIVDPKNTGVAYPETVTPYDHEVIYNIIAINDQNQNYTEGQHLLTAAYCNGLGLNSLFSSVTDANFVNPYSNNSLKPTSSAINKVVDTSIPQSFYHPSNDHRHCNHGNGAQSCSICNQMYYNYRPKYLPDHGAYESPYRYPLAIVKPTQQYFGIKFPNMTKVAINKQRPDVEDLIIVACDINDTIMPMAYMFWDDSLRSINAYKNDSTGEGYLENNEVLYYYFDASEDRFIQLYAQYDSAYSNQGLFVTGDSCNILNLYQKQVIPLRQGWNIFSTYIEPVNDSIQSVFKEIESNLNIVCNYDTCYSPNQYNGIGRIEIGKAYKVSMINPDTLIIFGDGILPEFTPIPLSETNPDWNLMGVLRNSKTDIEYVFENCIENIDHVKIIKNQDGIIYWPEYNLDFIDTLIPGQGYEVNMYTQDTLYYPANDTLVPFKSFANKKPDSKYFMKPKPTGTSLALGIKCDAWDKLPNIGDEIAVVNSQNIVIGTGVFNNENLAITVWGQSDIVTNELGLKSGEVLKLLKYNIVNQEIEHLAVEEWMNGESTFKPNSIRVINKISTNSQFNCSVDLTLSLFPNPVKEELLMHLVSQTPQNINLEIYSSEGKLIHQELQTIFKGVNSIIYNATSLAAGCYAILLKSNNKVLAKTIFVKN